MSLHLPTERSLIAAFLSAFPTAKVPIGPGDDAAVLPPQQGELCVTTDAVVEGVHFSFPGFSIEDVGYKALAVNLSDLAAMGARPLWFVCALELPRAASIRLVRRLARGMAELARHSGIGLVGGNLSRSPTFAITLTCAGEVPRGRALTRSGARPGDLLYVSGTLGDARQGLLALRAGTRRGTLRQRRPEPRLSLGLLARNHARAAMDISDGLARDVRELCRASHVGLEMAVDRLPLGRTVQQANARRAAAVQALAGGEDYELLLAVPPQRTRAFELACARHGEQVTQIGRFTRGRPVRFLWEEVAFRPPAGFDHFA